LEEWKAKPGWLEEEMAIVRMVRDQLSLTIASQEDILRINAICNTNTFRYHPSRTESHHNLTGGHPQD
jgi:hypothetical protein